MVAEWVESFTSKSKLGEFKFMNRMSIRGRRGALSARTASGWDVLTIAVCGVAVTGLAGMVSFIGALILAAF
jgi:hypothetical protein